MKTEVIPINSSIQIIAENHNVTQRKIINQAMEIATNKGLEIVDIKFHSQYPYNASITFTPNTKFSKYLRTPSSCPFCEAADLTSGDFDTESGQAWQEIECLTCGKEWRDIYQLSHFEPRGEVSQ